MKTTKKVVLFPEGLILKRIFTLQKWCASYCEETKFVKHFRCTYSRLLLFKGLQNKSYPTAMQANQKRWACFRPVLLRKIFAFEKLPGL